MAFQPGPEVLLAQTKRYIRSGIAADDKKAVGRKVTGRRTILRDDGIKPGDNPLPIALDEGNVGIESARSIFPRQGASSSNKLIRIFKRTERRPDQI